MRIVLTVSANNATTKTQQMKCHVYLAAQNKDGVDVGEDAMKAKVDVRSDQRKN